MLKVIVLTLLFTPTLSLAQRLDTKDFPWAKGLKESQVKSFHVCGDSDIQPTKKSLKKDFLIGKNKSGLLFSGMMSKDEYFTILKTENLESAKSRFRERFSEARLWKVNGNGEIKDIGSPAEIDLPFTATVKDCMEGAKTSLGSDCSMISVASRATCCQEKFSGPRIKWAEGNREYRLGYSPDPSVRLKVPGERKNRYCNVQRAMNL